MTAGRKKIQKDFLRLLSGFGLLLAWAVASAATLVDQWGSVDEPADAAYLSTPVAMAKDAAGNLLVADLGNSRVVKFSPSGTVLAKLGSQGTNPGEFDLPFGVTVDRQGNILVADTANHRIQKFDPNWQWLTSFGSAGSGPGQFGLARIIAVDSQNRYFITDEYNHRIQVFDSNGNYLYQFGSYGYDPGQFRMPQGIAIDANDNVYVADTFNHRVQKLTATGAFISQIGTTDSPGDSGNALQFPRGVAIDDSGALFVADTYNHKVKKYSASLKYLYAVGAFPTPSYPNEVLPAGSGKFYVSDSGNSQIIEYTESARGASASAFFGAARTQDGQFAEPVGGVAGPNGRIYISDRFNHRIQVFDASGMLLAKWGKNGGSGGYLNSGSGNGEFNVPTQLAADAQGRIYVADALNHRIQVFDADGNFLSAFGRYGIFNGTFNSPTGVAVDGNGNVFVADWGNDRIQKFNASFQFVKSWGSSGTGNGQFRRPFELSVDAAGNVYVADTRNSRVQKFDNDGNFLTKWGANGGNAQSDVLMNWGKADGELFLPMGVRVAGERVYVSDSSNNRVQVFDLQGNFVSKWGTFGGAPGNMFTPAGLAVDGAGYVYQVDLLLQRVQKFAP